MNYRIITDSACDFTDQMYQQLGLAVQPLTLNFRGAEHTDLSEKLILELYAGMRAGETATTSAVNPTGWAQVIEPVLAAGEDALVLAFSSGLSTTYQSAVIAAGELAEKYPERKLIVIDTLCASLGQGLFVWHACQKQREGIGLEELAAWCEDNKLHLCHWFTVDDLVYLKRGGRVSATTALVGSMLKIKPVMHMDDEGKLVSVSTVRGRKASLNALLKKVEETAIPGANDTMFICHGDCIEDAEYVASQLKEKYGAKTVHIGYTGAVIGSHSGPGTLAVFYLGTKR